MQLSQGNDDAATTGYVLIYVKHGFVISRLKNTKDTVWLQKWKRVVILTNGCKLFIGVY